MNLSLNPAKNPSTTKSQGLRSELPPTLRLIILAEMSAPRTNAKSPPIMGCVPPTALKKVRDLPFKLSKSGNRRSKLTTPPQQPKNVPIKTFTGFDASDCIVNKYERSASWKTVASITMSIRQDSRNRTTVIPKKTPTPCITYAKAVTFDVTKFTSSKYGPLLLSGQLEAQALRAMPFRQTLHLTGVQLQAKGLRTCRQANHIGPSLRGYVSARKAIVGRADAPPAPPLSLDIFEVPGIRSCLLVGYQRQNSIRHRPKPRLQATGPCRPRAAA